MTIKQIISNNVMAHSLSLYITPNHVWGENGECGEGGGERSDVDRKNPFSSEMPVGRLLNTNGINAQGSLSTLKMRNTSTTTKT